ncbi:hypothetical protein QAD02_014935 [Eretmocerus hayati]|uniref:Uncharacterized protein n=1 Tax=Eretmocerus hayati TaxID=131215 RepID=A0ACC2P6X5_9HYME|nr:hypothetical protein QAD02_014935 [Eretmocerus hayati]
MNHPSDRDRNTQLLAMFGSVESTKDRFLNQTRAAREERALCENQEIAARCIQKYVRRWLSKRRLSSEILLRFDELFCELLKNESNPCTKPALHIFENLKSFLTIYKRERDKDRMDKVNIYLVRSLDSESPIFSYIGVGLLKNSSISWISHMKQLLHFCLLDLMELHPEKSSEYKSILLRLHTLLSFTSTTSWAIMKSTEMEKLRAGMNQLCSNVMGYLVNNGFYPTMKVLLTRGLCRKKITLQPVAVSTIATLTLRPLMFSKMSENLIMEYLIHILSVPTVVHHLNHGEECQNTPLSWKNELFLKILMSLSTEANLTIISKALGGNYLLCLLGNLVESANFQKHESTENLYYPHFILAVINLLNSIQQYVVAKKSNTTYWHPILSWLEQPEDYTLQDTVPIVKSQLSHLWTGDIVIKLICEPLDELVGKCSPVQSSSSKTPIFRKAPWVKKNNLSKQFFKFGSPETNKIGMICSLYHTALQTFKEIRSTILTGLCYMDRQILHDLWIFLENLGDNCGLETFLNQFCINTEKLPYEFMVLILFCDCMNHHVTLSDDIEMYEQQNPFKLSDFVQMSYFLNLFLYRLICQRPSEVKTISTHPVFVSLYSLLTTLYRRDCQKPFCPNNHWLIKDVRTSSFLDDIKKGKPNTTFLLSKMPHILPHHERVRIFRRYISDENETLSPPESSNDNLQTTLITVHRSRMIEDGYRQLSMLSPQALKGIIRVRFINEQGLDEAGIDQDGVFKEFLEETIKRVFNPSFSLFKVTSDNRLYPSSTSYVQDNHLSLFEFIGRMLGKAVYEGIVVDIPFASFFVSQFCGQAGGVFYSCLDELASLDQDLYRSLTMIKHYDGDVSDLELTFSVDENVMGKLVTYELKPGGKAILVTNDNKINYIHSMAQFRMYVQIKDQIAAFTKGFRSLIKPEWFPLFSTPEWQRLISGDNVPIDLRDLRKHTQYYGGFHDKHRVISWLWDILENDFSESERSLFLKFVTSCSRSPLLGFAHLEPAFSVRCVEVSDDDDTGDTIGSVIRGFFTIRKKDPQNRLPTSSTCFNLLKLPNYRKKCTLREKLRYAVSSNTGFELS